MINYQNPDLTQHPPRSPRVRLGGYAHLPRLLDKARAFATGKNGEYNYNCPLDQSFFEFTGIGHEQLLAEARSGKSDTEMLAWVSAHAKRAPFEIAAWTTLRETIAPGSAGAHAWCAETIQSLAKDRDDIRTYFDLLDVEDYATFGGKA